jgi:hypothetical protein
MLAQEIGKKNATDPEQIHQLKRAEAYIQKFWSELGYR